MAKRRDTADLVRIAIASLYSTEASKEWHESLKHQVVDWPALVSFSHAHGLSPLLYHVVKTDPSPSLSDQVQQILSQSFHETAAFNLLVINVLDRVLTSLETGPGSIIVLKGAALILTVYDNLALRPMVDLDLLLEYPQIRPTFAALSQLGYQEQSPEPYSNEQGLFWNETMLVGSDVNQLQIEFHWHLIDNPYLARKLSTSKLIARSQNTEKNGQTYRVLAPDDQIVHLCIHNAFHHQYQLQRTMVDVAHVVHSYEKSIDWDRLLRTTESCNLWQTIGRNLNLAASDWYAHIPREVQRDLQRNGYFAIERLFFVSQRSEFLKLARTIITLPSLKLKLLFIKGQLLPRREFLIWRYGKNKEESTILLLLRRYSSGIQGLFAEIQSKFSRVGPEKKHLT